MRRDSCASSLKHLGKKKKTDCAANFHTHYPFLPQEHKVSPCVRTFDLAALVLCISPEAENHYKHFVSRYTCHAKASSDSRQSKVLVMPPVPALICMRAGTGLWCNCSSGEGQCLCPECAQYQSLDTHTALSLLYGNLHVFWRWKDDSADKGCANRWNSAFNCATAKLFYAPWGLTLTF